MSSYINFREDFKVKKVIKDFKKKEHYIMIKWSILQEDITVLNKLNETRP